MRNLTNGLKFGSLPLLAALFILLYPAALPKAAHADSDKKIVIVVGPVTRTPAPPHK